MDYSSALSFVLGSLVALAGTWLNHYFTSKREAAVREHSEKLDHEKWQREQAADETARLRLETREQKRRNEELFQQSLQGLAAIEAVGRDEEGEVITHYEKRLELIEATQKALSSLLIERPDIFKRHAEVLETIGSFTGSPESYAGNLREELLNVSLIEGRLMGEPSDEDTEMTQIKDIVTFALQIEDEFRKEQIIAGKRIPRSFNFSVGFEELAPSQRKKICDLHFRTVADIPSSVRLDIPKDPSVSRTRIWKAKLDPGVTDSKEILVHWERAWETELQTNLSEG